VLFVSQSRSEEEKEMHRATFASHARLKRDGLLKESDWTQLGDCQLTETQKAHWEAYRQALRDVTDQETFPQIIEWPTFDN
jgi:hypothetical protein